MTPRASLFALQLFLASLFALGFGALVNNGLLFTAGLVLFNIVAALAFNLLFGVTGLISFGQSLYLAAGAYVVAVLQLDAPAVPFFAALAAGGLVGGLVAFAVGYVALRRSSGVYFAMLTLTFAELLHIVITKTGALGRSDGLTNVPQPILWLGGLDLSPLRALYVLIVGVCAALIFVLWWASHSRFGRVLNAIRQDANRAAFLGVNVRAYRLAAFTLAGAVTATVGGLLGPWMQIVNPELAQWQSSTAPILHTLLGGAGFFWGPAVGAILFATVDYATRSIEGVSELVTGVLLLVIVLLAPGGLLGLIWRLIPARRWPASAADAGAVRSVRL